MTKRKFYKTIIQIEVLSEEPYDETNLSTIAYDITDGHCSGVVNVIRTKKISGKQAVKELRAQDSDEEFFNLDENGNDLDDLYSNGD